MSRRGPSVLALLCLLGLAGCTASPVQEASPAPSPPAVTPPSEPPPIGTPPPSIPPVVNSCTPRTCEDALAHCGELSDGCGGTLRGDSCPSGQRCGEDRLATVCVAPGGAPVTAWVKTFPRQVTALATASLTNIALLTHRGPEGERWSLIHSYSPGPYPPGHAQTPFEYSPAVFDAQGNVLVAGALEGPATFQGRPHRAEGFVLKLQRP